ncbi:hypothetical protein BDV93DRAFT_524464, partial [Ceratobasidium sp. AG-I]
MAPPQIFKLLPRFDPSVGFSPTPDSKRPLGFGRPHFYQLPPGFDLLPETPRAQEPTANPPTTGGPKTKRPKANRPRTTVSHQATLPVYYCVLFALVRGDAHRRQLPLELVLIICQYAGFSFLCPSDILSTHRSRESHTLGSASGYSFWNRPITTLIPLLKTAPVSKEAVCCIGRIEILLKFRSDAVYKQLYGESFFVEIFRQPNFPRDEPSTEQVAQACLQVLPLKSASMIDPFGSERRGIIDRDHALWRHLMPGDRIQVSVMGYCQLSPDRDCEAELRVFKLWKPSSAMLRLL